MQESPEFDRQQAERHRPPTARSATASPITAAAIARAFAISALGSITYYVGITYVPAFLTSAGTLERKRVAVAVDRRRGGRDPRHSADRRCCPTASAASRCWSSLSLGNAVLPIDDVRADGQRLARAQALLGAVVLAALAGGVSAVGAVATAEQFPGEGRVTGLALGATMATAIFGGLTPSSRSCWSSAPAGRCAPGR